MLTLARIVYALMVLVAAVTAIDNGASFVAGFLQPFPVPRNGLLDLVTLIFLAGFLIPCARASWRVFKRRPLLPTPNEELRPYLWAVTLMAFVGHVCVGLIASVYLDLRLHPPTRHYDVGGVGLFMMIAAVSYLLALWIGELVLVGRGRARVRSA